MTTNIHNLAIHETGRRAEDARTGALLPIRVHVSEVCNADEDTRSYVVEERTARRRLRRTVFQCEGYFDMRPSECARALGKQWASK